jgi:hypothetical protein
MIVQFRRTSFAVVLLVAVALTAWLVRPAAGGSLITRPIADQMNSAPHSSLAGQLAKARLASTKYVTNLGRAKRAGYMQITPEMPGMGYHFLNPNISGFNVRKPAILVYEHSKNGWQLGALEWVFTSQPTTPPLPDATFGTFPAACHYASGQFILKASQSDCPSTDQGSKFTFWHPLLYTMHVWIWYPNPTGLYASTNPLVQPFNKG